MEHGRRENLLCVVELFVLIFYLVQLKVCCGHLSYFLLCQLYVHHGFYHLYHHITLLDQYNYRHINHQHLGNFLNLAATLAIGHYYYFSTDT